MNQGKVKKLQRRRLNPTTGYLKEGMTNSWAKPIQKLNERRLATALPLDFLGNRQPRLWREETWVQTLNPLLTSRAGLARQLHLSEDLLAHVHELGLL